MIMFIKSLLIFCLIHTGQCLMGYDCGSVTANATRISLNRVEECIMTNKSVKADPVMVQVLQLKDIYSLRALSCRVEVTRTVKTCGLLSVNREVKKGHLTYIYKVSKDECKTALSTGRLTIYAGTSATIIEAIRLGEEYVRAVTLAGSITNTGDCVGTEYEDFSGAWENVIVTGQIKVLMQEVIAHASPSEDRLSLHTGQRYILSKGTCLDPTLGYTYWNVAMDNECERERVTVIYEGKAEMYRANETENRHSTIVVESDKRLFSLTLKKNMTFCNTMAWGTEHPSILIILRESNNGFVLKQSVDEPDNLDLLLYMNSKFVYMERSMRQNTESLYSQLSYLSCKQKHQALMTELALASTNPHLFAYNYAGGPGYAGRVMGEVIYVVQCTAVDVKIRKTEECFNELPVVYGGKDVFIQSKTRLIQDYGTEIKCNNKYYSAYEIEGKWVAINNGAVETTNPIVLNPNMPDTWEFKGEPGLATKGLYTEDELFRIRTQIMFSSEREAVISNFAGAYSGDDVSAPAGSILNVMKVKDHDAIARTTFQNIFHAFSYLSGGGAVAVFLYYAISTTMYIAKVGLTFKNLKTIIPGIRRALYAFFPPLAEYIMHEEHKKVRKHHYEFGSRDSDEETLNLMANATAPKLYPPLFEEGATKV